MPACHALHILIRQVVEYLRGLLDQAAVSLGAAERALVEARFMAAVDIELAFFDNAYTEQELEG